MPKLAAFPKAYMDPLVVDGSMTIRQWVDLASGLDIDGLEFYCGFLELADRQIWAESRKMVADKGLSIPMLCCSPDFTHPDANFRREQVELEKGWIDMTVELGGQLPDLSREDKQRAVRLLDERGAFLLRRSVDEVADALGVSRITVYNYLNAVRP